MPASSLRLRDIADHVQGVILDPADADVPIEHVRSLADADSRSLSYIDDLRTLETTGASTLARALLVPRGATACSRPAISVANPRLAFARAIALLHPRRLPEAGIHRTADVHPTAVVDEAASVGPYCSIGAGARIGKGAILSAHVHVGARSVIGDETELRPRVCIGDDVVVGARCLLHAATVVGIGGQAIPRVVIGDDVEFGARVWIEAGRIGSTVVGSGTKTDNLVRIGAGATLGSGCLMVSCSQVGEEAVLDHHVTLAGQAMVLPRVHVGAMAIVGARGKVHQELASRSLVSGDPAVPHKEELRRVANTVKLAKLVPALRRAVETGERVQ